MRASAFTLYSKRRLNVLITPCMISNTSQTAERREYNAIWDTGATGSVISQRVAEELNLQPSGFVPVYHAGGRDICPWFMINITTPNNIVITNVKVTQGVLSSVDALIGMDIISLGDFSITNKNNETTFSFRVPSIETIDYVKQKKVLLTENHYKWAMARVEELLPLVNDNTPLDDPNSIELELLSNMVADYSDEHFAIEEPSQQAEL